MQMLRIQFILSAEENVSLFWVQWCAYFYVNQLLASKSKQIKSNNKEDA